MTKGVLEMMGEAVAARAPLKRVGGPEDLKGLTVLLASDAGAFITGQIVAGRRWRHRGLEHSGHA
jgi:gluconate 5-dehydrogenase